MRNRSAAIYNFRAFNVKLEPTLSFFLMSRLVHFEIHATDLDRASKFYSSIFGWEFKKWEGMVDYTMIITGPDTQPGINGGMVKRMGPAPQEGQAVNAFVCTMEVDNVDAYIKKVMENGGSMALEKMAIPGVGWLAYCKDTEGNIFGMMQNDTAAK